MPTIAIIENDDLMDALLKEYLSDAGYTVRACAPEQAVPAEKVDLVIVDVYMPRTIGMERLRAARAMHPGTPLIAISGQFCTGLGQCGATAEALGAARIIAKPFNREELIEAVHAVIGAPTSIR